MGDETYSAGQNICAGANNCVDMTYRDVGQLRAFFYCGGVGHHASASGHVLEHACLASGNVQLRFQCPQNVFLTFTILKAACHYKGKLCQLSVRHTCTGRCT